MSRCIAPLRRSRGSVLITALLLATALGIGLVGYLALSRNALKLAHRTLFLNDATNLAEAGLEEALYSFNQMNAGLATATAWTGWTLTGSNATRTLTPFNRDQNAVGMVKMFVSGYDGSAPSPYVIAQATITSFDGSAPVIKVLRIGLKQSGVFTNGVVGLAGLDLKGQPIIDSFNSNPTNSPTGPWASYSAAIARANVSVIVKSGAVNLGNGQIRGSLDLGPGVTAPPASQVTGSIRTNYTGTFKMPAYPTAASVSKSYALGSSVPSVLPRTSDLPADDGRYYYFLTGATIGNTTIAASKNVTLVGTTTSLSSGLTVSANATCAIYIDGTISASSKGSLTNNGWAGALQILTTTTSTCDISGNGELRAALYAPNATLKASGGGSGGSVVGSFVAKTITATGQMSLHYDEALRNLNTGGGNTWAVSSWAEVRTSFDRSALSALTANFLP